MSKRPFESGATLVEFSLCFIIFIMIVFATIDFGRYMLIKHNLNIVASEAVRAGITGKRFTRPSGNSTVAYNREQSIKIKAIETGNRLGMVNLGTVNPYSPKNITVQFSSSENSYTSMNASDLTWQNGAGKYDDLVRVTVSQQINWLTPFFQWIAPGTGNGTTVRASCIQRNRGDEDEFTTD